MVVIYVSSPDTRLGIPDKNRQKESNNITKQRSYKKKKKDCGDCILLAKKQINCIHMTLLWPTGSSWNSLLQLFDLDWLLYSKVDLLYTLNGSIYYNGLLSWWKKYIYIYVLKDHNQGIFLLISWFFSWQNFCPLFKIIDEVSLQKYSFNYLEQAPICKYFLK